MWVFVLWVLCVVSCCVLCVERRAIRLCCALRVVRGVFGVCCVICGGVVCCVVVCHVLCVVGRELCCGLWCLLRDVCCVCVLCMGWSGGVLRVVLCSALCCESCVVC